MKIALYIEDGLEQIVLTPESDTEKGILGKLHDGSRELTIHKGSFFNCRGGWTRHTPHQTHYDYGYTATDGDESTMIVLRLASQRAKPERPRQRRLAWFTSTRPPKAGTPKREGPNAPILQ